MKHDTKIRWQKKYAARKNYCNFVSITLDKFGLLNLTKKASMEDRLFNGFGGMERETD
jgi:hypothetical protein